MSAFADTVIVAEDTGEPIDPAPGVEDPIEAELFGLAGLVMSFLAGACFALVIVSAHVSGILK